MFRLLGFNVQVQSGFVIFMALIVMLYGNQFGLWLAGSIAILTLIHELGHAVAARRTGAEAEISLGFLAGYASYRPSRELSRGEQAWISFAGPLVQIVVSVVVLLAMGVNPIDQDSFTATDASRAIWWAGPAIGLLNLIPVLPLDGGNIVTNGLDVLVPGRSRQYMLYFSIAATVSGAAYLALSGQRGFAIFIAFLLITQLQMLQATRPQQRALSAWEAAANALDAGKESKAKRMLTNALSHPQPDGGAPDMTLRPEQAHALIDLLDDPLPYGDPANEYVLANLLLSTRRYDEAAHYAAGSFARTPNTLSALIVARAAGALGDEPTTIGWLRSAAEAGTSNAGLASTIDRAPELLGFRQHPEVVAIRSAVESTR